LPWRAEPPVLYHVLLSEFMLQQTRVDQALPYYERFLARFPTLAALAAAQEQDVLKAWEGLGYYRRARYLHQSAQRLAGLPVPEITLDYLRACPGIGPYTLAAVGSIVFGAPLAVLDGNVYRVAARLKTLDRPPRRPAARAEIEADLAFWLDPRRPGDFNQALMELGATVCTPSAPKCPVCPLRPWCRAAGTDDPTRWPIPEETKPRPHHLEWGVILLNPTRTAILLRQRPPEGLLGGLWEFPTVRAPAARAGKLRLRKHLSDMRVQDVKFMQKVASVMHAYSHFSVTLELWAGEVPERGEPDQPWRWVHLTELERYPFPKVQHPGVAWLRALDCAPGNLKQIKGDTSVERD
jgi:A/G-specific adenine glycosylase